MAEHNQTLDSDSTRPAESALASSAEPHGPLRNTRPLSLVLGLLWLQSLLFLAFAARRLDWPMYMSVHLGLCAMTATFGLWWVRAASSADDTNDATAMVLQLTAWTALAGPFGTLIAAAFLVPGNDVANHAGVPILVAPTIGPRSELARVELLHGSLLDRRLRLGHAHTIRPLLDVMIEGTQIEKLDALSLIFKRYTPAMAPALRRALEDKDGSVRVLAATVTAQQHNAFTKRIGALQVIATATPENPNHWRNLGQAHLNYAESGLLEASRAETEVSHAVAHLARAARLEPGNAATQARCDADRQFTAFRGQAVVAAHDLPKDDAYRVLQHGT